MSLYKYEAIKLFKSKLCLIFFALLIGFNFVFGLITYAHEVREDHYSERYVNETGNIIYNAKMNYISIENKESENAQYQIEVIKHYSEIQFLDVSPEVRGYDYLLSSPVPFLCALLFTIIAAMLLTNQEHSANLILASFQHRRIKICFSKILLLFTLSFACIFVSLMAQTIGTTVRNGLDFSGLTAPIQCIPAYIHCPYRITVIQAVLLRFLFAFLTVFILSLVVFLVGIVTRKAIWSLLFTVLFFGGDYLLTTFYSKKIFSLFYQVNIRNFVTDSWIYRYSGKKIFCFFSQLEIFGFVVVLSSILLISLSVWRFRYNKVVQSVKSRVGFTTHKKQSGKHFLYYEIKKMWSVKAMVAIVLLLGASMMMLNATAKTEDSDLEKIYRYYINRMSALSYEEQVSFSLKTKIDLNQVINEASAIRERFINGEETHEKYVEAQQKAGAAELELDVLRVIDQQLKSIGTLNDQGIQAKLIYSTGWKKLIQANNQLFLLFAIMLLIVPYVAFEKESGFNAIMPGIFKDQRSAYRKFRTVKFLLAFFSSMIIVLLFHSAELLLIHSKYGLSDWTSYAAGADILFYNIHLKIIGALLLRLLFSALGITIIILFAEALMVFLKKAVFIMLIMVAVELPLYIVSMVTNGTEWGILPYFGFDLLYSSFGAIIIQTITLIALPTIVLVGYNYFTLISVNKKSKE